MSSVCIAAGVGCSRRRSAMMPYRLTSGNRTFPREPRKEGSAPGNTLISLMGVDTKTKAAAKRPPAHPNTWVFFDGEFARYHDVKLGLMTHALHYGTAVFEGIRAYWNPKKNQLYLLAPAAHYDRMHRSANVMRMKLPHTTEELVNYTLELLRRNEFKSDVYVRPLLYTSSEEIGVRLHNLDRNFFIYAVPFGKYVEVEAGIRCMVSSWRRVPDRSEERRVGKEGRPPWGWWRRIIQVGFIRFSWLPRYSVDGGRWMRV